MTEAAAVEPARPWWRRKRFIIPAGALALLFVLLVLFPAPENAPAEAPAASSPPLRSDQGQAEPAFPYSAQELVARVGTAWARLDQDDVVVVPPGQDDDAQLRACFKATNDCMLINTEAPAWALPPERAGRVKSLILTTSSEVSEMEPALASIVALVQGAEPESNGGEQMVEVLRRFEDFTRRSEQVRFGDTCFLVMRITEGGGLTVTMSPAPCEPAG